MSSFELTNMACFRK